MNANAALARLPAAVRCSAERLGAQSVTPLGRSGATFVLATGSGRVVVKRMQAPRALTPTRAVLDRIAREPSPLGPRLLDAVPGRGECWYGLFEYVERAPGAPTAGLEAIVDLLGRIERSRAAPDWALEPLWLARLRTGLADEPAAQRMLDGLQSRLPDGPRLLAHGDFNLPNIVVGLGGTCLVDWEELGAAAPGFDAGWLLALGRTGAGLPWSHDVLAAALVRTGLPQANLDWFERLGILRLLYRARTLAIPEITRPLIVSALRRTLADVC